MLRIISGRRYNELLSYKEKYQNLSGEVFTYFTGARSRRAAFLQLTKEELVRIIFDFNNKLISICKNR